MLRGGGAFSRDEVSLVDKLQGRAHRYDGVGGSAALLQALQEIGHEREAGCVREEIPALTPGDEALQE